MTNRERILNLAAGKEVDRKPLFFYFGPWPQTMERWQKEGLRLEPQMDQGAAFRSVCGLDAGIAILPVNLGYAPAFTSEVLEDLGERLKIRDALGVVQLIRKEGASIPHYIDYPVKCREDWLKLKEERLNPETPGRIPDNFDEVVQSLEKEGFALQLGYYPYGLFGTLRDMIGVEDLLMWFYDEPELIREMMDDLTTFWLAIYQKVIDRGVKVDVIHIWEDMSGKTGPLISPKMVREFMAPNYRRIRDFADRNGIPIMVVDTDGDVTALIEPFMEAGVNMLLPFEVQAGMDICKVAKEYPELAIMGGFDKRVLWDSREAIDREVERLRPMFEKGMRYFVAPDHLIPPEVPYELFQYFLDKIRPLL